MAFGQTHERSDNRTHQFRCHSTGLVHSVIALELADCSDRSLTRNAIAQSDIMSEASERFLRRRYRFGRPNHYDTRRIPSLARTAYD